MGALASAAAAGRLAARRDARRPDPAASDFLGSIRGHPREVRGPRAARLYTEWFPAAAGGRGTAVFTHGYCLTEAVWHYQKRDLAGGAFSMVTWDLPGHGHSPPLPPERLTLQLSADALARVVDEYADDGGVVLAGHSLGGVVTMAYLSRHPETARKRVRGLLLVSTPVMYFADAAAGRWPGASLEARAVGGVVRRVVASDLFDRLVSQDVGRPEVDRLSYQLVRWGFGARPSPSQVRFVRDVLASVRPEVRSDTFRIMAGHDLTPMLPEIEVPVLVVIGGRDHLVNPEESKALAARLPRGRGVLFPDAGHASFLERPKRFNREARTFIESRLRPRSPGPSARAGGDGSGDGRVRAGSGGGRGRRRRPTTTA
jgi:pimeloyl-ACP methyl ester carboxylesterase